MDTTGFTLTRSLVVATLAPLLFLASGCASLPQGPRGPTRVPPNESVSIRVAIETHDDGRAVTELNQIKSRLMPPLRASEKKELDQWLRLAADQGAACPHHLVRELIDAGASLDPKDLKPSLSRWLTCRGLMAGSFTAASDTEEQLTLARALLEALPRQVEAGSLVIRKALLMENRPLGHRILDVTREQFSDYGLLFHTLQREFDQLCTTKPSEFCPLREESRRLQNWFRTEAERKRGLVFKSQIDPTAQSAFLELIETVYGPLLTPDSISQPPVPVAEPPTSI